MSGWKQSGILFFIGAGGYNLLELCWRGYTHWSMGLAGGICFALIYWTGIWHPHMCRLHRCLLGSGIITSVEFTFGCVFNLVLGWNIWDYSQQPFHFMGQICLLYSILWFLLCMPVTFLGDWLKEKMYLPRHKES